MGYTEGTSAPGRADKHHMFGRYYCLLRTTIKRGSVYSSIA